MSIVSPKGYQKDAVNNALEIFRYTESQLEYFTSDNKHFVYAMFVKDKFGDNGLTGVCVVKEDENNSKNVKHLSNLKKCHKICWRNCQ